ncbi:phage virion morphogenesis protein [Escherichia coli]
MNEFKRFEDRLTGLIESLSPSGRRRLSAELAKRLRQSQQRRVMAQKAPDGTPYAPRQQQSARKKTGRVWGSDQFWAELVQPGRTSKPCVARGVVI